MEAVINDIQPIITLKNCGGKMAEGGTDGEFIANVYDDYDAEVGTTVTSMYADGGMMAKGGKISDMTYIGTLYDADDAMNAKKELLKTGNFSDIKIQKVKQAYQLNKYARGNENYFMWRIYVDLTDDVDSPSKYERLSKKWKSIIQKNETYKGRHKVYADGGMMAKGGMTQNEKYDLLYNFVDEKMIEGDEQAERIINGELPNGYNDLYDFVDEKMIEGDSQAAKVLNQVNKMAYGGMMAYAYGLKDYRIVGFYSDGFEEDLGNSNDLSEAIEMANAEQMKNPEYETVKVLEEDDYDTIVYYSTNDKKALGGFFGNSRYNTGRSWHLDHARHNKKENYEKPLNKRSRRFKRK
jgi:hypothetical protein